MFETGFAATEYSSFVSKSGIFKDEYFVQFNFSVSDDRNKLFEKFERFICFVDKKPMIEYFDFHKIEKERAICCLNDLKESMDRDEVYFNNADINIELFDKLYNDMINDKSAVFFYVTNCPVNDGNHIKEHVGIESSWKSWNFDLGYFYCELSNKYILIDPVWD